MLQKEQFGSNFKWGVSTAAYQIEGGYNRDGKGLSIWDVFVNQKAKIQNNQTGKVACNFYEYYAKDLTLMAHLNIPNYRFSISWSRIFPNGTGEINNEGVDFYNRVIDLCLELGIEPWITLYHWDLPYELEKKGGWTNREVINWFSEFIQFCIKQFGGRVKNWIVLNEPVVFTGAGYFLGIHAPGKKGLNNFLAAAHHAALCQAEGGRIIKSFNSKFNVGTSLSCSHIESYSKDEKDESAAKKVDALLNRFFIEPLIGLGYPVKDLKILNRIEKYIMQDDEAKLKFDMDFIGIQNYTREIVRYNSLIPYVNAKIIKANKRNVETTLMNWEIFPNSIYNVLKKYHEYDQIKEIIITENGAAFPDIIKDGKVEDKKRIKFLNEHIAQVYKAKQEGVNVTGYFIWTFLDNFEWAEGFTPRFGLVYVNFNDQRRIVKESGYWFSKFLKASKVKNAFSIDYPLLDLISQ